MPILYSKRKGQELEEFVNVNEDLQKIIFLINYKHFTNLDTLKWVLNISIILPGHLITLLMFPWARFPTVLDKNHISAIKGAFLKYHHYPIQANTAIMSNQNLIYARLFVQHHAFSVILESSWANSSSWVKNKECHFHSKGCR